MALGPSRLCLRSRCPGSAGTGASTAPALAGGADGGRGAPKYGRVGRPRQDAPPIEQQWSVQAQLHPDPTALEQEVRRKAAFLVATNGVEVVALPDMELIRHTKPSPPSNAALPFLKDPLFLASLDPCEKAAAHHGAGLRDGAVLVGLPPR